MIHGGVRFAMTCHQHVRAHSDSLSPSYRSHRSHRSWGKQFGKRCPAKCPAALNSLLDISGYIREKSCVRRVSSHVSTRHGDHITCQLIRHSGLQHCKRSSYLGIS